MLDLLIHGGTIIDGTGNPGYAGYIAVQSDRIKILGGDVSFVESKREIKVSGRIVCPGFIDMHAHSGLVMLSQP